MSDNNSQETIEELLSQAYGSTVPQDARDLFAGKRGFADNKSTQREIQSWAERAEAAANLPAVLVA